VPFDPLHDATLPEACDALVAGGGFPEVYAEALAANGPLLADLRAGVDRGLVVWAECGGLLWLARSLDDHPMAGVVGAEARMTDRLTLGYRCATTTVASPLGPAGTALRGHEFHYSTIEPAGDALDLEGRFGRGPGGFATPRLLASYLHLHLGAAPDLAEAFVRIAASPPP
jgi:cobyrinic acid a,c-diamide synthase